MLNAISSLKGLDLRASDGDLGTVSDFLFDDSTWTVRWLVADTGGWLSGRKVLIHPSSVVSADYGRGDVNVALSMAQVKESPGILHDSPVSRQMQDDLSSYYGYDPVGGGSLFGAGMYGGSIMGGGGIGAIASPLSAPVYFGANAVRAAERGDVDRNDGDPHLRSIAEVTGYHVHATDGEIGHVQDFLVESDDWSVRSLVVDTSNWWVGQHVLISPAAVKKVDWSERHISLDIARADVRSSPSWNPANPITGAFEHELQSH